MEIYFLMLKLFSVLSIFVLMLSYSSSNNDEESLVTPEENKIAFDFYSHDISEIQEISNGVYTAFASGNSNTLKGRLK